MAQQYLRVAQVASGDLWAGAEVQLFTLCSELIKRSHIKLLVVLMNGGELAMRLRELGVQVEVLPETELSAPVIFNRLVRIFKSFSADVVHTHRFKENILGSLAAARCGIPSVRTVHGAQEHSNCWCHPKNALIALNRLLGCYLQSAVVPVTDDLRGQLLSEYPQKKLVTIPNGVSFEYLKDVHSPWPDDGVFRIGIVGRLTPVKRIELFLSMAERLLANSGLPSLAFYVIGDGPLMESLQSQVGGLEGNRVTFCGHVAPAYGHIAGLDVLVMCSDHEGMPMTVLEAMYLGTPVVAHRVGGLVELLVEDDCGVLVEDHSAEGYAQALEGVLGQLDQLQGFVERARQRVVTTFSAERNAEQFAALYRRVVSGAAGKDKV